MWRNVVKCGEVLATLAKQSNRLSLSVNSQQHFYPTILRQHRKAFARVLSTVRVEKCQEILKRVARNGEHVSNKPYEQVCQKIIINRKLTFSANYIEVTIKSISKRSTNCRHWGMWGNMATCGEILETLAKQSKRLTLSVNG